MKPVILITGANGCVGRAVVEHLLAERAPADLILLLHRDGKKFPFEWRDLPVQMIEGDIAVPELGLSDGEATLLRRQVNVVVHGAADTRLTASYEMLERTNVTGTERVLTFARGCRRLEKFVHLSTTCVAGKRTGVIPEAPLSARTGFVNGYERTKWEAERRVLEAGLPAQIVRLSTVVGSERDGRIPRWGAAHLALYFLYRGLLAMVPGHPHSTLDFISSDLAAQVIAAAALQPAGRVPVLHASAGQAAMPLNEFLDSAIARFALVHNGWARGALTRPPIVDELTFRLFRESVALSRDLLFNQILACTQSFLPGLLYPKICSTANAEALLGRRLPTPPWRQLAGQVIDHCLATNWKRPKEEKSVYACSDPI